MMVLDASAAIEVVRKSPEGMAVRHLMNADEVIASCELFRAETASVFRKLARAGSLTPEVAESAYNESIALVDEFYSIECLQTEAFRESVRLDHSTYDLFYFVLARRTGATLITLDRKLMRLCEKHGVSCITEVTLDN